MRQKRTRPGVVGVTQLSFEEQLTVTSLVTAAAAAPPDVGSALGGGGEWLEALVADLAIELGDAEHRAEHQAQVTQLWHQSTLSEGEFGRLLMEVRAHATSWRSRIGHARSNSEPGLRMTACLLLLRDRLGLPERTETDAGRVRRGFFGPPLPMRRR